MRDDTARSRASRLAATVVVAIAVVFAFASLGGVGIARGVISIAQYQYGKKVTICHKGKNTITVSVNAWPAHQRHGDAIGPCATTSSSTQSGAKKGGAKQGGSGKKGSSGGSSDGGQQGASSAATGQGNGKGNGGKGKNK